MLIEFTIIQARRAGGDELEITLFMCSMLAQCVVCLSSILLTIAKTAQRLDSWQRRRIFIILNIISLSIPVLNLFFRLSYLYSTTLRISSWYKTILLNFTNHEAYLLFNYCELASCSYYFYHLFVIFAIGIFTNKSNRIKKKH